MAAPLWRVVGASVAGTSHITLGRACEDDHAALLLPDGGVVVAIADGAGSASRAAEGSACAVETVVAVVRDRLAGAPAPTHSDAWQPWLTDVFGEVRAAVERLAANPEVGSPPTPLRELATTLLVLVATADWLAVAQVGDGAVVVQRTDQTLETVTTPDHGEYVNQASFLTDAAYAAELQCTVRDVRDVAGMALFTDGLERLALVTTTNEAFAPFFRPLFAFATEPDADTDEVERFLTSDRVCRRTDDDKTLVLVVRAAADGA
jgi:serine/threonine protein phosphatase PrpC